MNILVSGATGYIGRNLCRKLLDEKHNLIILTRDKTKAQSLFGKDIRSIDWSDLNSELRSLTSENQIDCIINLAGEPIAEHRWNKKTKDKIIGSRINTTKALVNFIKIQSSELRTLSSEPRIKVLINASAIGYYGNNPDIELQENSPSGNDFLAELCKQWEAEALEAEKYGVRVVTIRTGVVLGTEGALKRMLLPYRFYVGGPVGTGRQWLSWVHIEDLVNIYHYAINEDKIKGPVNATSPNPVTMKEFCQVLGKVMHKPSWFRVPSFILKLVFGEMADVLLSSQKVIPSKLINSNFRFQFPSLSDALKEIINNQ